MRAAPRKVCLLLPHPLRLLWLAPLPRLALLWHHPPPTRRKIPPLHQQQHPLPRAHPCPIFRNCRAMSAIFCAVCLGAEFLKKIRL